MDNRKKKTAAIKLGDLENEFNEHCKIENLTPSQLIRKALLQYFRQPEKSESNVSFSVENKHDYGEKKKVVVTFTETEFQALEQLKKICIKANLSGSHYFNFSRIRFARAVFKRARNFIIERRK